MDAKTKINAAILRGKNNVVLLISASFDELARIEETSGNPKINIIATTLITAIARPMERFFPVFMVSSFLVFPTQRLSNQSDVLMASRRGTEECHHVLPVCCYG